MFGCGCTAFSMFLFALQTLSDDVKSPGSPQIEVVNSSISPRSRQESIILQVSTNSTSTKDLVSLRLSYHTLISLTASLKSRSRHPALRCLALRKKRADLGRFPRLSQFAPDYQGSGQVGPTRAQSGEVPYTKDVGLYLGCNDSEALTHGAFSVHRYWV